jgi:hypothetical protein
MFGDIGNGVLKGGENSGANYFDCGDGLDTIIDFNPAKGDITAGNCEIFSIKYCHVMRVKLKSL